MIWLHTAIATRFGARNRASVGNSDVGDQGATGNAGVRQTPPTWRASPGDRGLGGEQAGRREDVLPVDGDGGVLGHLPAAGVVGEQRGEHGAGGSGLGMAQDSARAHDERDPALSAAVADAPRRLCFTAWHGRTKRRPVD